LCVLTVKIGKATCGHRPPTTGASSPSGHHGHGQGRRQEEPV